MTSLSRNNWRSLGLVIAVEASVMAASRYALRQHPDAVISVELFRTALRIGSAALYWWLFRDIFRTGPVNTKALRQTHLKVLIPLMLLVPVLCANDRLLDDQALVFALTSIFVGIKEEILFRGILQGLCRKLISPQMSVVLVSLVFTAWHYGVQPFNFYSVSVLFVCGLVLGLMYEASQSLLLVIVVHTLYDVLHAVSPILAKPYHPLLGWFIGVYCVALAYSWAAKHTAMRTDIEMSV